MTKPPRKIPTTRGASLAELLRFFDENGLQAKLDGQTPAEIDYGPAPKHLGFPEGTVSFAYLYADPHGDDFALVAVYRDTKGRYCGGRKYHPIAILIDGVWCHTTG